MVDPAGKLLGYRGADTDVTERKAAGQLIHRRQRQQTGLHRALEVEVVVELFSGGFVRADIQEMQRAETCLHLAGRRDARRYRRGQGVRCW